MTAKVGLPYFSWHRERLKLIIRALAAFCVCACILGALAYSNEPEIIKALPFFTSSQSWTGTDIKIDSKITAGFSHFVVEQTVFDNITDTSITQECLRSWTTCSEDDVTNRIDVSAFSLTAGCTMAYVVDHCEHCASTGYAAFLSQIIACVVQIPVFFLVVNRTSGMTDTRFAKFTSIWLSLFVNACLYFSLVGFFGACYQPMRDQSLVLEDGVSSMLKSGLTLTLTLTLTLIGGVSSTMKSVESSVTFHQGEYAQWEVNFYLMGIACGTQTLIIILHVLTPVPEEHQFNMTCRDICGEEFTLDLGDVDEDGFRIFDYDGVADEDEEEEAASGTQVGELKKASSWRVAQREFLSSCGEAHLLDECKPEPEMNMFDLLKKKFEAEAKSRETKKGAAVS